MSDLILQVERTVLMEQEERWYSTSEVARMFKKTDRTILRWIDKGDVFPNARPTGPFPNSPKEIPQRDVDALKQRLGWTD